MVIADHGPAPVHLPEGEVLGRLHPVIVVMDPMPIPDNSAQASTPWEESKEEPGTQVATVQTEMSEERERKLLAALGKDDPGLTTEEQQQIRELVIEFEDLRALSSTELGRTTVVEYSICTGDHSLMKQAPH